MEPTSLEAKYQKLATEYSKVRAQASVLKRALLDEQQKSANLRESLRQRDTSLRRIEQEVDSLGFRNKQLEHRVSALQDDLRSDPKKAAANASSAANNGAASRTTAAGAGHVASAADTHNQSAALFADELQTRISENARLASQLADQAADQQRLTDRCAQLEQRAARQQAEHAELERRLRKDLDTMCNRAAVLETRLSGGSGGIPGSGISVGGSEDTLSVSDHEPSSSLAAPTANTTAAALGVPPSHTHRSPQTRTDNGGDGVSLASNSDVAAGDRVAQLEREIFQLRTQLEFVAVRDIPSDVLLEKTRALRRASNGPLGAPWTVSKREAREAAAAAAASAEQQQQQSGDTGDGVVAGQSDAVEREKWVLRHFSEKLDRLFADKMEAESRAVSYVQEVTALQANMELLSNELNGQRKLIERAEGQLQLSEEDLATTRINYEEQISVLTEQLISLSDQLAMAAS